MRERIVAVGPPGILPARTAQQRFAVLRRAPVELSRIKALLEPGLDLAIRMDHPIYDCLYLTLALSRRTKLVSADRRFVNAVRRHPGLAASVVLLSEIAH